MLKFIFGGAGFGKSCLLIDKVNQLAEQDKKIIFIVPEQFSFESDKKIYKALGTEKFNKILSLSFTSLAKEIFEKFGGRSGEYAEDIHKYILMNKTIKELSDSKALSCYERQAKKTGFVSDALGMINEFRQCGISSDELLSLCSSSFENNDKIRDLSLIYSTYDGMMSDAGLKDSLNDISEAAAVANMNDYFRNSIVIMDEFESFTGDEYELIDVMFAQADDIYIALRLENPGESGYGIFDSVKKTWKSFYQLAKKYNTEISDITLTEPVKYKSGDLAFLNKNILRSNDKVYGRASDIEIAECRDLYEEADYVCSCISRLVREENYKYRDIAVISRQLDEYIYILEAAFRRYNIPFFMDVKKTAFHTRIMQFMVNTVDVVCEADPDTETILRYVKTQFGGVTIQEASVLENYCYEWGITGRQLFEPFTADMENNPAPEEIRKRVMDPIKELREKCKKSDCREVCKNLYDFLYQAKIPLRISELNDELIKSGLVYQAKEQKRMWDTLMTILETFSEIGGDISLKEFQQLFDSAVKHITYSVPPQTLDSVHIARAETARPASPKAVFILGVNEGFFPFSRHKNGLLNDRDRARFESAGMHLTRGNDELVSDEKLVVYKSLTYASEKLYILYPTCDSKGAARFPASVISQIKNMFDNNILTFASDKGPAFYSSTPQAAYNVFVKNFGRDVPGIPEIKSVLAKDEYYSSRIEYLYEIAKKKDFHIDNKELMKKLYSDRLNISATGFETFQLCRFRFFCKTGLKLRTIQKRQIGSPEQGNIVHKCLEEVFSHCKTKEEFDRLDEASVTEIIDRCVSEYMDEAMGGDIKNTARLRQNIDNIKGNILKIIFHLQEELKQSQFRPVEFEYEINKSGLPTLKADNGIEIILRGYIDRVDIFEENGEKYVRVIDYKTGKTKFSVASLLYGINMQMLLYMFSITDKNGKYADCAPAGVLYMPSKEIVCERDRDDKGSIDEFVRKNYKMNGVVLKERSVLNAMEKDIMGVYIPAKLVKSDGGSGDLQLNQKLSTCFSSTQFVKLREHTEGLLKKLAEQLYDGDIEADPLILKNRAPCEFCDYWSVCGNIPCINYHEASGTAEDDMYEILSGE
ncbi:MAG: PD-(D/E)XK nuclease family protein [Porcipelethomonas sp.]